MKKERKLSVQGKRVVFLAAALILFLIVTNPSILWFLSPDAKSTLLSTWQGLFGDVGEISRAVTINWVSLFKIVAIILTTCLLTSLVKLVTGHIHPKTGKGQSIVSMISSFITYAAVLVAIIWCLTAIGLNLSTVFASVGIIALIVGFAAESLIADIITGIFLVFEDEFNVGDIVELNGFRGTVESIGIRVTSIKDLGGNVKVINNSAIRDILNRSKAASRAICDMPISYGQNIEQAEKLIDKLSDEIVKQYPEVFPTKPRYLGVQGLDASAVVLRMIAEVEESRIFEAQRLMYRTYKMGFDAAGVEIPFQQVVVHQGAAK